MELRLGLNLARYDQIDRLTRLRRRRARRKDARLAQDDVLDIHGAVAGQSHGGRVHIDLHDGFLAREHVGFEFRRDFDDENIAAAVHRPRSISRGAITSARLE